MTLWLQWLYWCDLGEWGFLWDDEYDEDGVSWFYLFRLPTWGWLLLDVKRVWKPHHLLLLHCQLYGKCREAILTQNRWFFTQCWLGWGELRVLDHRPASRNFSLAPKICLRTLTSHQKELFQRKETLHNLMCTGKFTQTGATLTVFFIKGARDEAPLTTIFSLVQYLL